MKRFFFPVSLLSALLFMSCANTDFRAEALGEEGQVTVMIDSALWNGPVGDALREEIEKPIFTLPSGEPTFEINQVSLVTPYAFEMAQARKNVLLVAAVQDTTTYETRLLRSMLSEEVLNALLEGETAVVPRNDLWRKRQQVHLVAAASPEGLVNVIREQADNILYRLNETTRFRMHREMFDIGRQHEIEEYLMDNHGFAVHGQHDYVVAMDTSNFIWLRRVLSDTWRSLFIYYEENADPSRLSPEWVIQARDVLTQNFVRGSLGGWVEVDRRRPLEADSINFKERSAYEIRGLWHMVGEENGQKVPLGQGGPFLTYAFYDESTRHIYIIDGMVFAPNYPKREFLRQLEVIAHTFRTRAEVAQDS